MGKYKNKVVRIPKGMKLGSEVFCSGEGDEVLTIDFILRNERGEIQRIALSHGCYEPLSKICLKNGSFGESVSNPNNWIFVAIGECDICKKTFPDSCVFNSDGSEGSMICQSCWGLKNENRTPLSM